MADRTRIAFLRAAAWIARQLGDSCWPQWRRTALRCWTLSYGWDTEADYRAAGLWPPVLDGRQHAEWPR